MKLIRYLFVIDGVRFGLYEYKGTIAAYKDFV